MSVHLCVNVFMPLGGWLPVVSEESGWPWWEGDLRSGVESPKDRLLNLEKE